MLAEFHTGSVAERPGSDVDLRVAGANELFVDPAWWRVLRREYAFDVCVFSTVANDGSFGDSVPVVHLDDPAGERLVSLPFCDLVDSPCGAESWALLADDLLARGLPLRLATPSDHPVTSDDRFSTEVTAAHHVVDLQPEMDELRAGYSQLTRRQIRRATKSGITYRFATCRDALEAFYWLHVGVRKHRHKLLPQSYTFFEAIADEFFESGRGGIMLAEADGAVVGGCLLLETPTAIHYKFSAADPDFANTGVSHGAVDAALVFAREMGKEQFDFGRSELTHTGLVDFKRRFGPAERTISTHQVAGQTATNHAFRSRLGELTALYVNSAIPDQLTAAAGAHLYRYFA